MAVTSARPPAATPSAIAAAISVSRPDRDKFMIYLFYGGVKVAVLCLARFPVKPLPGFIVRDNTVFFTATRRILADTGYRNQPLTIS